MGADGPALEWLPTGWSPGHDEVGPLVRHDRLGVVVRPVPGGRHRIGLSDQELAAARRLSADPNITVSEVTPVVEVDVAPDVLLGEVPITVHVAADLGVEPATGDPHHPAMLTRDEAESIVTALGGRLPSEAEWEVGCRGGASTLFVWGDDLPPEEELGSWLSWDLRAGPRRRNALGLGGLFFGEWCQDPFRLSHAADAEVEPGAFVVKGGGAQFWPWQDEGWVWCASAMRMPSSALFDDRRCAVRVALAAPST